MFWRVAIFCWFWLAPCVALAQTVALDSGEHGTFTRLTLPLAGGNWSLTRVGTGYDLSLPGVEGFDLSRVFEKIARGRIAAITQIDGSRLRIELACDCTASAFVWRGGFLVIDVSDDAAPAQEFLPPVVRPPDALPGWFPTDIALPLPFAAPSPPAPVLVEATGAPDPYPALVEIAAPEDRTTENPLEDAVVASDFEATIAQDLARAATQGLLTLTEPTVPGPKPDPEPLPESAEPPPLTPEPPPAARPGVKIETSIDRAFPRDTEGQDPLEDMRVCLDQSIFLLPDQAEGQSVSTTLAAIRAALFPDPERIDLGAASDLVRALISFGFGAEARLAIGLAELPDDEAAVLRAMAHIVDGETPGPGLADQATCSGDALLWAYLAGLADAPNPLAPLILAFRDLPGSLREPLGYRLAARLAVDGAQNEADAIYQLASGGEPSEPALASLAAAQLDHQAGQPAAARRELETALAAGARPTPALLLDLFAAAETAGQAVSDAQVVLIEEAIFSMRGAPEVLPLEAALIRARIGRAELTLAQQGLKEKKGAFGESLFQDLSGRLAAAALTAPVDAFLRIAFDDDVLPGDTGLRQALAERLAALGFRTRAAEISQPQAQEATAPAPILDTPKPVAATPTAAVDEDPVAQARLTLETARSAVDLARQYLAGGN